MAGTNIVPEGSTPILIGVGQVMEKGLAPELASAPMELAAKAAAKAISDSGAEADIAALIDTVAVVRLFSDSSNRLRLSHGFGRAENPPQAVAARIANGGHRR